MTEVWNDDRREDNDPTGPQARGKHMQRANEQRHETAQRDRVALRAFHNGKTGEERRQQNGSASVPRSQQDEQGQDGPGQEHLASGPRCPIGRRSQNIAPLRRCRARAKVDRRDDRTGDH